MGEEKIMALFNRSSEQRPASEDTYVTRDEVAGYVERLEALEALAQRLRSGDVRVTDAIRVREDRAQVETPAYDRSGFPAAARGEDVPAGRVTSAPGRVDYGAVAFGLSEIKRKVSTLVGFVGRGSELTGEYEGAVQYFCDVFAKSDPDFNADTFKRQAGV